MSEAASGWTRLESTGVWMGEVSFQTFSACCRVNGGSPVRVISAWVNDGAGRRNLRRQQRQRPAAQRVEDRFRDGEDVGGTFQFGVDFGLALGGLPTRSVRGSIFFGPAKARVTFIVGSSRPNSCVLRSSWPKVGGAAEDARTTKRLVVRGRVVDVLRGPERTQVVHESARLPGVALARTEPVRFHFGSEPGTSCRPNVSAPF